MQTNLIPPDSKIEATELFQFIKQTFSDLQLSSDIKGYINVRRRTNDLDFFFVEFFATSDFASYKAGNTYTSPDLRDFSIVEVEDGPDGSCRERLDHFINLLNKEMLRR